LKSHIDQLQKFRENTIQELKLQTERERETRVLLERESETRVLLENENTQFREYWVEIHRQLDYEKTTKLDLAREIEELKKQLGAVQTTARSDRAPEGAPTQYERMIVESERRRIQETWKNNTLNPSLQQDPFLHQSSTQLMSDYEKFMAELSEIPVLPHSGTSSLTLSEMANSIPLSDSPPIIKSF